MDAVLTALALLGVLFVIFGEGTTRMTSLHDRRMQLVDQARSLARALRLQLDVEHPQLRFHGLHALGRLVRSVALEPRRRHQLVLEVGLRRPVPIALRARRSRGAGQLEVLSARVLASEALLDARLEALLGRELTRRGQVEVERECVRLVLDEAPRDADDARALLVALAEVAELVEARASELESETHPAHRMGFLPSIQLDGIGLCGRRLELELHAPDLAAAGARLVLDADVLELRAQPPVTIALGRPFRALFSRSHDAAGRALFHLELRQRDLAGAWQRLALSSRTSTFGAPVDALPVKAHRAPFVPEPIMLELLARLRGASLALGSPLEHGGGDG